MIEGYIYIRMFNKQDMKLIEWIDVYTYPRAYGDSELVDVILGL